jgi:inner membrane protein
MDPLTQGALGAAWAQPAARGERIGAATVVGCAAGMAPDLDFLIRSGSDPLLAIEYHRHFTHALAFIPVGALIVAILLYPIIGRSLRWRACYGFSLLGYASHGLLDACTSYGTQLLWPFSDRRIAWDLVSVIDPLFTVPLIALVVVGVLKRRRSLALIGLAWCLGYLGFASVQNRRATAVARDLAAERGHVFVTVDAKPSLGNPVLFRTIYAHDGRYYVDAVRVGLRTRVFEGGQRESLDLARDFPWLARDSQQWRDVERFRWFAEGYLAPDPGNPNRIVDLRYSLVPNRLDAFWGIELDPVAPPDAHAAYVTMRIRSTAEGGELLRMLFR